MSEILQRLLYLFKGPNVDLHRNPAVVFVNDILALNVHG